MRINKIYSSYGYLVSIAFVAAATAIFHLGKGYLDKGQWALIYLLVVLIVAGLSGTRPAILTAAASFLAWNYFFIPPYNTLVVNDPKDWLFLLTFLIVAIIVGLQTGRLKQREMLALARERETDLLKNFSARLVSDISLKNLADLLVEQVKTVTGCAQAGVFLPDENASLKLTSFLGNIKSNNEIETLAKWSYSHIKAPNSPENTGLFLPLQSSSKCFGVLFVGGKTDGSPFSSQEIRVLSTLVYQASALLERKKLQQVEISAKARNQSDKFKSTIISSIHHELKTPLSSINATVTNLLEKDSEPSADTVKEELSAIKKDLNRLNSSIGSLVDLSRLETADWEPKKDWYEFGEILGSTLSRIGAKDRKRIKVDNVNGSREINVDFIQISRVLQIIIENGLAYSGSDKTVKIEAALSNKNMKISIEDNGPGIDNIDKEHIFDKFYRGKTANSPGTGLGLAIASEIINFHGGSIAVKDANPQGSCFVITLPAKKRNYWE